MTAQTPWRYTPVRRDQDLILQLNRELEELADYVERMHAALRFGPVEGAYFPLHFSFDYPAGFGALSLPFTCDLAPFDLQARPIMFDASVLAASGTASIDVQIYNVSTAILASTATVANTIILRAGTDFALRQIEPTNVNLQILAVNSGTPIHLRATLWLKAVSKVEEV